MSENAVSPESSVSRHGPFYDTGRKEYLAQDARGVWQGHSEQSFARRCRLDGISSRLTEGEVFSPLDEYLTQLQDEQAVDYAGPIAGYQAGFYEENGFRFLVTKGPSLIAPESGSYKTLQAVLTAVFRTEGHDQLAYFHGWLKCALESLYNGSKMPGQALVMVGPAGCGKSLIQSLITCLLGGREAKPYSFMTSTTRFNGHLIGAEHLRIGDENPHTDMKARRNFGAQIKNICVEEVQNIELKYREAISLKPFWRLSMSLNDEPENLMVLPPLDEHTRDKLIILRTQKGELPMPTGNCKQRKAFWNVLIAELPAYISWLQSVPIPSALACERYGITHFHHPEIVSAIENFEPHMRLLTLIDQELFSLEEQWKGSAAALEQKLCAEGSSCRYEGRKLLNWNGATGRYLARLAISTDRVRSARTENSRDWIITCPSHDA